MIAIDDIVDDVANLRSWSADHRKDVQSRYLNFLRAAETTTVSDDIDAIWHAHILHTRRYRQDCNAYVGHFVDHEPCPTTNHASNDPCGGVNGPPLT